MVANVANQDVVNISKAATAAEKSITFLYTCALVCVCTRISMISKLLFVSLHFAYNELIALENSIQETIITGNVGMRGSGENEVPD